MGDLTHFRNVHSGQTVSVLRNSDTANVLRNSPEDWIEITGMFSPPICEEGEEDGDAI